MKYAYRAAPAAYPKGVDPAAVESGLRLVSNLVSAKDLRYHFQRLPKLVGEPRPARPGR